MHVAGSFKFQILPAANFGKMGETRFAAQQIAPTLRSFVYMLHGNPSDGIIGAMLFEALARSPNFKFQISNEFQAADLAEKAFVKTAIKFE